MTAQSQKSRALRARLLTVFQALALPLILLTLIFLILILLTATSLI